MTDCLVENNKKSSTEGVTEEVKENPADKKKKRQKGSGLKRIGKRKAPSQEEEDEELVVKIELDDEDEEEEEVKLGAQLLLKNVIIK